MADAGEAGLGERKPAYVRITEILRDSVREERVPPGAILLEGPLAALFQSSRSPVKQALTQLEREGLLRRFEGRGLVAGTAEPLRLEISAEMLAAAPGGMESLRSSAADPLYYGIERELILHSLFGSFRVNELALARHCGIGRTVAREILLRAERAGILSKGDNARWWTVPLDKDRFRHLYQLREVLEPVVLESAAGGIPSALLAEIALRHRSVARKLPDVEIADLDRLEEDLHVTCLGFARNPELFEALKRSRSLLVSGKHLQMALLRTPMAEPFMNEHLDVLEALQAGRTDRATVALSRHLRASGEKALERLEAFRARQDLKTVAYIDS